MPLGGSLGYGVGHEAAVGAYAEALPDFHTAVPRFKGQRAVLVVLEGASINLGSFRTVNDQSDEEQRPGDGDEGTQDSGDHKRGQQDHDDGDRLEERRPPNVVLAISNIAGNFGWLKPTAYLGGVGYGNGEAGGARSALPRAYGDG